MGAHRYAFEVHVGPIPQGLYVCHTCDNRRCINPEHLFLGTHQDNMDDRERKGRNKVPVNATGSKAHRAKLTEAQVAEIRAASGPSRLIAAKYGISDGHTRALRRGAHFLPEPPQ